MIFAPPDDASVLRAAAGKAAANVAIATRPPAREHTGWLFLATPGTLSRHFGVFRDLLADRRPWFGLFEPGASAVPLVGWQDVAVLAAATRVTPYLVPDRDALRRLMLARGAGAADRLVGSAAIDGDDLVAWSCEPRMYRAKVSEFAALSGMSRTGLASLEVSASGSRIHWDAGDVDLDLDSIRLRADPEFKAARERKVREDARSYAAAIRALREAHGLAQGDIAGLSERQVRRLEEGLNVPRSTTLAKLARAHGLGLDRYMDELACRTGRAAASRKKGKGTRMAHRTT